MRFIEKSGIDASSCTASLDALEGQGKTAVIVAAGGRVAGVIAVSDSIKESSRAAVADLAGMGLRVYMVTGDNRRTAEFIAGQAGIEAGRVIAGVLPGSKAEVIRELQRGGATVAMV